VELKANIPQSSDEDSDSDDGFGRSLGDNEGGSPKKERRPSTTEALRRTSLEDDDEGDEVVHVVVDAEKDALCPITLDSASEGASDGIEEKHEGADSDSGGEKEKEKQDDGELVEIQSCAAESSL